MGMVHVDTIKKSVITEHHNKYNNSKNVKYFGELSQYDTERKGVNAVGKIVPIQTCSM